MDGAKREESLNIIITDYLKRKNCHNEEPSWIIKKSALGGVGVFTTRDIQPGEVIFLDFPILLGPRFLPKVPVQCSICFNKANVNSCDQNCSLMVCDACSTSETHSKECHLLRTLKEGRTLTEDETKQITRCLAPLRSLILIKKDVEVVTRLKSHRGSQHGREVDVLTEKLGLELSEEDKKFLYFVCTVLDANAFEVLTDENDNRNSIRGLYPLGSLANHRCFPNVFHVFDNQHRMVVRASVFIEKGVEIFHSYTRLLWGTTIRVFHLQDTKHFFCKCDRCLDVTEFGTYMSAIYCKKCKGNLLPTNPFKHAIWRCETCQSTELPNEVARTLTLVGSVLKGFKSDDFQLMYNFLKNKLASLMPDSNQVAVELKYKIIWILGYKQGYLWNEMSLDLLLIKKQFCEDILGILERLRLGKCKIRGLLSYELYLWSQEMKIRINSCEGDFKDDLDKYITEAADILKYDASAPNIIKQRIKLTNCY